MKLNNEIKSEIILYQPDSSVKLDVWLENETVWLTQSQIAMLFGTKRPSITKHLNNIFNSGELEEKVVCSILEHTTVHGAVIGKTQIQKVKIYNLDAILSVGYRVNSVNATRFRQWANKVLKEYLLKGYAVNQRIERLEKKVAEHDDRIDFFVKTSLPPVEGIFYEGQIFDAYAFASNLIKNAKKYIALIDNYIDESVLIMLSKRNDNVKAIVYTGKITSKLQLDIDKHNAQYAHIEVVTISNVHDRFLMIDETTYHLGASIKDLGKKLFAFSKMNISSEIILKKG